jgi:DNA-directed RNA polymerase subunit RPC12/RpoP
MGMLLPFPHSWPVRCAKCGHTGTVTAATADLAAKPLRCRSCGHRQPFAPKTIAARGPHRSSSTKGPAAERCGDIGRRKGQCRDRNANPATAISPEFGGCYSDDRLSK